MSLSAEIKKQITQNIERLTAKGAEYTDARFYTHDDTETLLLYDGNLEAND